MSEENVELVQKSWESFNRGDLDGFLENVDEHIVIRSAEGWPEPVYYGKDAVRSFAAGFADAVGGDSVVEDAVDAVDRVVVRIRTHYTGEQSGLEGDVESSQVVTFRNGSVILVEYFWDHAEALEAAGLSE